MSRFGVHQEEAPMGEFRYVKSSFISGGRGIPRSIFFVMVSPFSRFRSFPPRYTGYMRRLVSHTRESETPEAKARWFRSLPVSERMELLCEFTDLALSVNPDLPMRKDAQPSHGRVRVLSKASG